jgi:hypothetical protein
MPAKRLDIGRRLRARIVEARGVEYARVSDMSASYFRALRGGLLVAVYWGAIEGRLYWPLGPGKMLRQVLWSRPLEYAESGTDARIVAFGWPYNCVYASLLHPEMLVVADDFIAGSLYEILRKLH